MNALPSWPDGLSPYRRTPEFSADTIPGGLLRAHSTRPGTWARVHILEGSLGFRDLVDGTRSVLGVGIHALIHPQREHQVEQIGPVRFFVEFCAFPDAAGQDPGRAEPA